MTAPEPLNIMNGTVQRLSHELIDHDMASDKFLNVAAGRKNNRFVPSKNVLKGILLINNHLGFLL